MRKDDKCIVKPLNDKELQFVLGGYADPRTPSEILGTEGLPTIKKENPIDELTKFY